MLFALALGAAGCYTAYRAANAGRACGGFTAEEAGQALRQGLLAAPSDNYNDHRSISASLRRAASARY